MDTVNSSHTLFSLVKTKNFLHNLKGVKVLLNGNEYSLIFNCSGPSFYDENNVVNKIKEHFIYDSYLKKSKYDEYKKNFPNYNIEYSYDCNEGNELSDNIWFNKVVDSENMGRMTLINRKRPYDELNMSTLLRTIDDIVGILKKSPLSDKLQKLILNAILKIHRHPRFMQSQGNDKIVKLEKIARTKKDEKVYKMEYKLRDELYEGFVNKKTIKIFNGTKTKVQSEVEANRKIRKEVFGNLMTYFIFNCKNPSYLESKIVNDNSIEYKVKLVSDLFPVGTNEKSNMASFLTKAFHYKCNKNDQLWYNDKKDAYIALDTIGHTYTPIGKSLLSIVHNINNELCTKSMLLWHHPKYIKWTQQNIFKSICETGELEKIYEKDIEKIRQSN